MIQVIIGRTDELLKSLVAQTRRISADLGTTVGRFYERTKWRTMMPVQTEVQTQLDELARSAFATN
jgi:hypothetical protein